MRMDRSREGTAAEWLAAAAPEELRDTIRDLGDEDDAAAIAREIVRRRESGRPLVRTEDLVAAVLAAKGLGGTRFRRASAFDAHPAARTFQAVRMAVNRETEHLAQFLRDLPWILRPGARVAVITFHAGEEKLVREAFESGAAQGRWRTSASDDADAGALASGRPPSPEERRRNPRSRSARLWSAVASAGEVRS
jgi:16S rRNA (cytosine1402-N4)-methyltransferase